MTMKNQNRQKGVALLLALILLFLITAIAFGVIVMSNTESAINTNYKSEETEYFAARAGVEEARYRLLGAAVDQSGNSIALTPPTVTGSVLYILGCKVQDPTTGSCQTQMTMADVTTPPTSGSPNPYFDDELCHDIPGSTQLAQNVRCTQIPAVAQLPAVASSSPYPMDYKWVRVMMKENGSVAPYPVVASGTNSAVTNTVCFDKTLNPPQEISTPLPTDCSLSGSWPGARPVYMITALALNSGKNTRRLAQEEVTLGVVYYPTYAIYNTSNACPSMVFTGNGMTGSFASVAGNTSNPPPGASTTSGANVATNGGINMGAGNPTIAGQAYETNGNPPTCFTAGKNQQPPAATYLSPNLLPPPTVYPAPNPPPPTTNTNYHSDTTLTPGNTYGNVNVGSSATLTLQVPAGQGTVSNPATFVFNSLTESGQGTIAIAPASSGACGGTTTCYVKVVIAGNGQSTPLDLSGGSLANPSGVPATLVFDVAQPTGCSAAPCGTINLSGGSNTYCIVNAPMDAMNVVGNGDIFGSLTSYTSTMKGNGTIWYDRNLGGHYNPDTYLSVLSYRELSY